MNKLSAAIIAAALTASLSTVALAQDTSSMAPGAAYGAGITDNPSANHDGELNGPAAGLGGNFGASETGMAPGAELGYGITENPSANHNADTTHRQPATAATSARRIPAAPRDKSPRIRRRTRRRSECSGNRQRRRLYSEPVNHRTYRSEHTAADLSSRRVRFRACAPLNRAIGRFPYPARRWFPPLGSCERPESLYLRRRQYAKDFYSNHHGRTRNGRYIASRSRSEPRTRRGAGDRCGLRRRHQPI